MPSKTQDITTFPIAGNRYKLNSCINQGCYGKVYLANDTKANQKQVAIKIQKIHDCYKHFIDQEYKILRGSTDHPNLIDFYAAYRQDNKIWFVIELCEGGTVLEFVQGLLAKNRRITEEHVAYILKETVKALVYLHEHRIIHRDVKSKNILMTRNGEVKLCDFGFSCSLKENFDKTRDCLGSPNWMAPEIINTLRTNIEYDNRVDVWSLGITAIEIADGQPPYYQMHPTRILFQIVTNPPPNLMKIANWTENFIDFINECLVKNPEFRPFMVEIAEHPFLEQIPENNYHLSLEIKAIINDLDRIDKLEDQPEVSILDKYLKNGINGNLEQMYVEDLASLYKITENTIMQELESRMKLAEFQTFIGDILLILNPNEIKPIYDSNYHHKYHMKSRSDNAPHIYSTADSAYQNALHHNQPQRIILSGESGSGKTFNYHYLIDHLIYMGRNENINSDRLKGAIELIQALTHASTPTHNNSTRCLLKTDMKFNATGKVSGAIYKVFQLEKCRVSYDEMNQGNFHFLYYIHDGLIETNRTDQYLLKLHYHYRYLRINEKFYKNDDKKRNCSQFRRILKILEDLEFDQQQINTILSVIVGILLIGEIRFQDIGDDNNNNNNQDDAIIENYKDIEKLCKLLQIERKKFCWALTNSCIIKQGIAMRKANTVKEAQQARDVLANILYARLVDWIVGMINQKLAVGRSIFGEKYSVQLFDYFGFECFKKNTLSQLLINTLNEEIHYHYLQRIFAWETLDISDEQIEYQNIKFYDNKKTLDLLLDKSIGLISYIDEVSKYGHDGRHVLELIEQQEQQQITVVGVEEFSVAHFTGKIVYNIREMPEKNRDFLPPEIIETMRLSGNSIVRLLFSNKLNRTGNLSIPDTIDGTPDIHNYSTMKSKRLEFSQTRKMRTTISVFKSISLELLKELSIGGGSGGTHFIRCIRTNLKNQPDQFNNALIRQQVRALAVVETAKARQTGYPHRISFSEFLRRYQFLAFDFNETVEITPDNCRLLLIRLKMEDWAIGKSKVFLKYYNEEYLSRLYESHVRKIIKIQSILRGFLAKCRVKRQTKTQKTKTVTTMAKTKSCKELSEDEAASIIQKAYRESTGKKTSTDFAKDYKILDEKTCNFLRPWALKWRKKSLFQTLLQYRAAKLQDFFNFSQQVHFYNLAVFHETLQINDEINVRKIDLKAQSNLWLGERKSTVLKVPFRLDEIPFYNTNVMCNALTNSERNDDWDSPYRWRELVAPEYRYRVNNVKRTNDKLTNLPYNRDPDVPIKQLEATTEDEEDDEDEKKIVEKIVKQTQNKASKEQENKQVQKQFKPTFTKYEFDSNTKLANKDFDYIKTPTVNKLKHVDPVFELRQMANQNSVNDEDDPPYNFRAMLRKTNYQKEPQNQVVHQEFKRFSIKKTVKPIGKHLEKKVSLDLAPGVHIVGVEIDL